MEMERLKYKLEKHLGNWMFQDTDMLWALKYFIPILMESQIHSNFQENMWLKEQKIL